ncbi:iron ABC transporter permease [Herbaspirillum sp. YR522]|uniref:FecCD family ABC transporter permease n=1 Tax=Herbaspirillum sp. YR522 TaxID=1144342 RepID=UPI00026FCDE2|nr:iron ABC transporter permease [Herbaspirillum sp. YR522]EJM95639.1 ABC-type Fe3+-siderophore transport system, permease component [Herbaspirillum sp. YR522]
MSGGLHARLRQQQRRRLWLCGGTVGLLVLLAVASLSLGVRDFGPLQVLQLLGVAADDAGARAVLLELRLPRTVMALVAGAGLALSGAAMQGVTRNVLVSPYTMGISPAAAFGASLAILAGANLGASGAWLIVSAAFASAVICALLVLGLAALRGVTATMLVLGGIGLTHLFAALTASVQFVASEQQLSAIVQWTFGSLNGITWHEVGIAAAVLVVCAPVLLAHAWALNAFAAGGDEVAASLGFPVGRVRTVVTVAAVMITAAIVSFTGVIGFVGLVAPHIARLLVGGDHRWLLPLAAACGAILVLAADTAGRLLLAPVIVPVGIVVAYIGVPLFLHLLLGSRHGAEL